MKNNNISNNNNSNNNNSNNNNSNNNNSNNNSSNNNSSNNNNSNNNNSNNNNSNDNINSNNSNNNGNNYINNNSNNNGNNIYFQKVSLEYSILAKNKKKKIFNEIDNIKININEEDIKKCFILLKEKKNIKFIKYLSEDILLIKFNLNTIESLIKIIKIENYLYEKYNYKIIKGLKYLIFNKKYINYINNLIEKNNKFIKVKYIKVPILVTNKSSNKSSNINNIINNKFIVFEKEKNKIYLIDKNNNILYIENNTLHKYKRFNKNILNFDNNNCIGLTITNNIKILNIINFISLEKDEYKVILYNYNKNNYVFNVTNKEINYNNLINLIL